MPSRPTKSSGAAKSAPAHSSTFAPQSEGPGSLRARSSFTPLRSGRDQPDLLIPRAVDHEVADDAGDVALVVEVHRAGGAGVVDVLAGLDQFDRLGPVAGTDRL